MPIHVIRHAHAGSRRKWTEDDEVRPLSKRGRTQAAAIAVDLAEAGIDLLLSSRYLRCIETLEPLAAKLDLEVTQASSLAEGNTGPLALQTLLEAAAAGHTVAACSHGDVIPDLIRHAVSHGASLSGPSAPRKGERYELVLADGAIVTIAHVSVPDVVG